MSKQDNPAPVLSADTKKSLEQIIVDVAKKHNVKAMELTTKHLSIISDCMEEYAVQQPSTDERSIKYLKSEYDIQILKMKALGIDTENQFFEQCVSTALYMAGGLKPDISIDTDDRPENKQ